jgi:hypothetical protein
MKSQRNKEKKMKNIKLLTAIMVVFLVLIIPINRSLKSDNRFPTKLYVSCDNLDFYRWSKNSNPTLSFFISNSSEGTLKGDLIPSSTWIKLSDTSFESNLKEIIVNLDVSNLPPGLYKEKIEIKSNGGVYTLPVRLDLVEKKVIIQMNVDNPTISINTKPVEIKYPPFIKQGLSYLPLRIICESFGATLSYEASTKKLKILYQDLNIEIMILENYMVVNGYKWTIEKPAEIRQNITFVPLSVIKTIFDPFIQYNPEFRLYTIVY